MKLRIGTRGSKLALLRKRVICDTRLSERKSFEPGGVRSLASTA